MGIEQAVQKVVGPCVILAGAGTGKTHTIVEKIKYLITNKVCEPKKIICITFSNEATSNVFMRVQRSVELSEGNEPIVRTFHAFSADLLRQYGSQIGIKPDFKILDSDEAMVLLHKQLRIQPYYCKKYVSSIGMAKDLGISIEALQSHLAQQLIPHQGADLEAKQQELQFLLQTMHLRSKDSQKQQLADKLQQVQDIILLQKFVNSWRAYEKIKEKHSYLDYSDLNTQALALLEKMPQIANDFSYVIVDEFQDTNKIQLDFLLRLAPHGAITIVGDLNQSIYRFRGAYKENFAQFKKHFNVKEQDIFTLNVSYRSPNSVLRLAHQLILHNYTDPRECFEVSNAMGTAGDAVEVYELKDGKEEARKVVELVKRELMCGMKPEDICIMFRTHQQGRVVKRALEAEGISFTSVTKQSLLNHSAVKTIIDYLTVLHKLSKQEKGGEQAWWDLLYRLSFKEHDLMIIGKFMKDNRSAECISKKMHEELVTLPLSESGRMIARVVIDRINHLLTFIEKDVVALLPEVYARSGLIQDQKVKEGKEAFMNLQRFLELAQTHASLYTPDLASFLHYLEIIGTLEIEIAAADTQREGVQLMTNHATKGLEYKVVIVTNMAQKRFPMERIERNPLLPVALLPDVRDKLDGTSDVEAFIKQYEQVHQLAEERRLCYVAFTRAKERLILTYAQNYAQKKHTASQFLQEIKYTTNPDCLYLKELDEKYKEPPLVLQSASRFTSALHSDNFDALLPSLVQTETRTQQAIAREHKSFSPSALLLFNECQKQYEYHYVYHMPERRTGSWESMRLGSFIHLVLEKGVKNRFNDVKQFLDYAKELSLQEDWATVSLSEAAQMIRVFFERNKTKYTPTSVTEQSLPAVLGGIPFSGFADRIDIHPEGLEIIDYKTGKYAPAPLHRMWQLGYYALAARTLGKVHKITLDMLKQDKPLEFVLDEKGNAQGVHSDRMDFNIYEVEEQLIATAKSIMAAHETGFKACHVDKNCEFCNEYVYGL